MKLEFLPNWSLSDFFDKENLINGTGLFRDGKA